MKIVTGLSFISVYSFNHSTCLKTYEKNCITKLSLNSGPQFILIVLVNALFLKIGQKPLNQILTPLQIIKPNYSNEEKAMKRLTILNDQKL